MSIASCGRPPVIGDGRQVVVGGQVPRVVRERPPEFPLRLLAPPGLRQGDAEVVAGQRVDAGDGHGVAEERDTVAPEADLAKERTASARTAQPDASAASARRPGSPAAHARHPRPIMSARPTEGR